MLAEDNGEEYRLFAASNSLRYLRAPDRQDLPAKKPLRPCRARLEQERDSPMSETSSPAAAAAAHYLPVRQSWLDRRREPILDPDLPIVDPHHHLWDRPGWRYLLDELLADTNSGHNIVATVFIQARVMHRQTGPVEMRPVGETEFVNGIAAMSASGIYGTTQVCAGIVGHADLALGGRVEPILQAHIRAGGDRFRGIRHITTWDADASVRNPAHNAPPGLLADGSFRERDLQSWCASACLSTPGSFIPKLASLPISLVHSRTP
jgi:hypothetical protein